MKILVFPIRNEGIPIQIKNTNRPEDEGTLIVETYLSQTSIMLLPESPVKRDLLQS